MDLQSYTGNITGYIPANSTFPTGQSGNVQASMFTYLVGPQMKVWAHRSQPFECLLFGGAHDDIYVSIFKTLCQPITAPLRRRLSVNFLHNKHAWRFIRSFARSVSTKQTNGLPLQSQRILTTKTGRLFLLLLMTLLSMLVHGYHMGTDDAAIYAPGIEKAADPSLFPAGSEFFMHHATLSVFPRLVASITRLSRAPIEWSMLLWFVLAQFLLLWAGYQLAERCFRSDTARWAAVGMLASLLNLPVAGTALTVADSYLTARSLSTPLVLMAVNCLLGKRTYAACFWLLGAFLIHPQMAIYGTGFWLLLSADSRSRDSVGFAAAAPVVFACLLPVLASNHLQPAQGAYREALASRSYFLVTTWHWWEWVGIFAPLTILAVCAQLSLNPTLPAFTRLAKTLVGLGLISTAAALVLATNANCAYLLRLQPMRSFHLIYVMFCLLLGGLVDEYLLRARVWRWALCFSVLSVVMFKLDVAAYPASPHIERPGVQYQGEWLSSFLWIRDHTPKDAVFALDSEYFLKPGVDLHGFRAIAERSMLADHQKDGGAASVFPDLAERWKDESSVQSDWEHLSEDRLQALRTQYRVSWVLLENSTPLDGVVCPYSSGQMRVCRIVDRRRQLFSGSSVGPCCGLSPNSGTSTQAQHVDLRQRQ